MLRLWLVVIGCCLFGSSIAHNYEQKVRRTDIVGANMVAGAMSHSAHCSQIQLMSLQTSKDVGSSVQKLAATSLLDAGFVVAKVGNYTVISSRPFHSEAQSQAYLADAKKVVADAYTRNCS